MKRIFLICGAVFIFAVVDAFSMTYVFGGNDTNDNTGSLLVEEPLLGKVYLHQIDASTVNKSCLLPYLKDITQQWKSGETTPFRVRISKNHNLTKQVLSNKVVEIQVSEKEKIFVPVAELYGRILIISKRNYALHSFTSKNIDIPHCFE